MAGRYTRKNPAKIIKKLLIQIRLGSIHEKAVLDGISQIRRLKGLYGGKRNGGIIKGFASV